MNPWYKTLYENFSEYDMEPYTQNTEKEVEFLIKKFIENNTKSVLDVGCGTGRHAVSLAKAGFQITGIDLSGGLLQQARKKAEILGVSVDFKEMDATHLPFDAEFDAVILMCEGAFSMMETDEKEQLILDGIGRAVKPGGLFLLTTTNAMFMFLQNNPDFDPITFREKFTLDTLDKSGKKQTLLCNQRYYTPPELRRMLIAAGFEEISFFAVTDAGFADDCKPEVTQFEFGAVCKKRAGSLHQRG